MTMVYVKPRPGGRVRMPERNFQPMKPEGSYVPRHDYYERLIITGDVIITDPPVEEVQPSETKEEPPHEDGSFASAPSKEK